METYAKACLYLATIETRAQTMSVNQTQDAPTPSTRILAMIGTRALVTIAALLERVSAYLTAEPVA